MYPSFCHILSIESQMAVASSDNAYDFYSGGTKFKSRLVYLLSWLRLLLHVYRVYQNSTAKLQERTPHIETRNKVYDNMGPEMHNYRIITRDEIWI
jgi:hypothetical protein